jgi:hypothetical protein
MSLILYIINLFLIYNLNFDIQIIDIAKFHDRYIPIKFHNIWILL